MENSLSLSVNVPETITTKELAETLGVSNMAIMRVLEKTKNLNGTVKVENGKQTRFTEQQVTIIKQEIQKHHNLSNRQIDNVSTELEILANARSAFLALDELYKQKEIAYKATIENQNKQIEALTPDAESWRKFAESDGTFSATNVAKLLKISRDELLDFLKIKHYIMRERSDNPNKKGRWQATALGIERGYVVNYLYTNDKISHVQFHITPKGMQKIEQVFCHNELTPEEQKRLEKICKEAEKNMRPSVIGLAE